MIFVRRVNGKYQVCLQEENLLTILASFWSFFHADDCASQYKTYRPLANSV